jgi:pimeloyl-ACP methyl ester carboxylesterase
MELITAEGIVVKRLPRVEPLPTGADARLRNEAGPLAAVFVNGGTARAVPGTWSATSELLVDGLAPRFPRLRFLEVRYRIKTWNALQSCIDDAAAAIELATAEGARAALLVGFSMGGAVAIGAAGHDAVAGVVGLAPWIPDRLRLDGLRGKRLDVVHGSWDRHLPGIPGVSPASSREGFERARTLGVAGTYTLIPGGLHGCAVRSPLGGVVPLPRWGRWVALVGEAIERFQAE